MHLKMMKWLSMQRISPQGYNNKIRAVTIFLQYLQVKDDINHFTIPVFFYKKKSYPKNCEVKNLDKKLDLLMLSLSEFPDQLRIMSLILLYTGERTRPELASHIQNMDDYDTIFLGFPNWLAYHNLIQCTQG